MAVMIAQRRKEIPKPKRRQQGDDAGALELAKTRGLMQIIERIITRHHRGECRLDEETFRLYEVAKSIKWANTSEELLLAILHL